MSEAYYGYNVTLPNGNIVYSNSIEEALVLLKFVYVSEDAYELTRIDLKNAFVPEDNILTVNQAETLLKLHKIIEMVSKDTTGYFKAEGYTYMKPPIMMTPKLLELIQASETIPEMGYDSGGEFVGEDSENCVHSVGVYGAFVSEEDVMDASGFNCTIAMDDSQCYAPIGQHASFHYDWLAGRTYIISIEDYKAACSSWTPPEYIEALERSDPYDFLYQYVIQDEAFPTTKAEVV